MFNSKTMMLMLTCVFLVACEGENKAVKGVDGAAGSRGEQGERGATGAKGDKGDRGEAGERGEQGVKGDTGATGATGQAGVMGAVGQPGKDGKDGLGGSNGQDGKDGKNPLLRMIRSTSLSSCQYSSGVIITSGLDDNSDGELEESEVHDSSFVCDGYRKNNDDDDCGDGKKKIYICHKEGKVNKTLKLPESAAKAHIAHGDTYGKCN